MAPQSPDRERLAELLAGEAADGIGLDERAELERLLEANPPAGRDEMMRVAGLAQIALLKRDVAAHRAMPAAVRTRLARQAEAWSAGRQAGAVAEVGDLGRARRRREEQRREGARSAPVAWRPGPALGWFAAAALAVVMLVARIPTGPVAPAPAAQRTALLEHAPDVVRVSWSPSAEPGFERATGDVVWSSARQEGYLRLAGLPANDARRQQYQLWVVDPARDSKPVDGGVFDIGPGGEVVVPIHAKLRVGRPTAFAITLEQEGGVVVSDGPMLLVAAVKS